MLTIEATIPLVDPPSWAILERRLFDALDQSVEPFLAKYTREDGSLIWRDTFPGRDGADDFYESFYNWPLLYLLGGSERVLAAGRREWDAVTAQLTALGHVSKEYERGYDWFHQGESNLYFYFLCMAEPSRAKNLERAGRFAGLYLNEDPTAPNYDAVHKLIRAPHNGSDGPRWGFSDGEPSYGWAAGMARYGLPYHDVPGITSYDDLKNPDLARRMGAVMHERMGRGDVPANLAATSLLTNAFLVTGDEKYRQWVLDYVDAWSERARRNGGLLPDNVGLSGKIGEYLGGKWYGGLYGWTWPHGFYNIGMAAIVAASNALLLTGNHEYLDLARTQVDRVLELGQVRDVRELEMSLDHHWFGQVTAAGKGNYQTLVVPYRYGDSGWFDYQPMSQIYPTAIWNASGAAADWERLERIRRDSGYDWNLVLSFRTKEDSGHEAPWLRFLAGENPSYPEAILRESLGQVCWRLDKIRADHEDLTKVNIHHWQQLNPVLTEALVQLTLGAPQVIYNGGLMIAPVRYFDGDRRQPGLPLDVSALVTKREANSTTLTLVNLNPVERREVIIQSGALGEHRFTSVHFTKLSSEAGYPGSIAAYSPPSTLAEREVLNGPSTHVAVHLPPGTQIEVTLEAERFVSRPSYADPWASR